MLSVTEIMDLLPHRYPFLLVDRVLEFEAGKRIVAIKNVTINEPFFTGHFPGYPVMPGVLIVEALAQAGGIVALKAIGEGKKLAFFGGIDNCKFRRPVVPGDQLRLEATVIAHKGPVWKLHCEAFVGEALAARADLTATLREDGGASSGEGAAP